MQQRMKLIMIATVLVSILVLSPLSAAFAGEGEATAPEEANARGPGAIILMVGIASIGLVGFAYSSRKSDDLAEHNLAIVKEKQ